MLRTFFIISQVTTVAQASLSDDIIDENKGFQNCIIEQFMTIAILTQCF